MYYLVIITGVCPKKGETDTRRYPEIQHLFENEMKGMPGFQGFGIIDGMVGEGVLFKYFTRYTTTGRSPIHSGVGADGYGYWDLRRWLYILA